jgi:SAM-dependent methyltransferase
MIRRSGYGEDMASIHDRGFSAFSETAALGLLRIFDRMPLSAGTVVELGCGTGRLARHLSQRGYDVIGIDSLKHMTTLARKSASAAKFRVASVWNSHIPSCGAVIAVGEVLNYQFDGTVTLSKLHTLFERVYRAVLPGGLFVFDLLHRLQNSRKRTSRLFTEGPDWFIALEKQESPGALVRTITAFRWVGGRYRKVKEVHKVARLGLSRVTHLLHKHKVGFIPTTKRMYTGRPLPGGHVVIVSRKPV